MDRSAPAGALFVALFASAHHGALSRVRGADFHAAKCAVDSVLKNNAGSHCRAASRGQHAPHYAPRQLFFSLRRRPVINRAVQGFANTGILGKSLSVMSAGRIEQAMTRITAAIERIEAARAVPDKHSSEKADGQSSARVMSLVNAHEKLREEVADTIGELDALIEELEE